MENIKLALFSTLIIFLTIWSVTPCLAKNLELVRTKWRLPGPVTLLFAVYDGDDSIYMLSGNDGNNFQYRVVKFSVDTEEVTINGTFASIYGGQAVMNGEDIFYYGGETSISQTARIYRYSTRQGYYSHVATLPAPMSYSSVAWDSANQLAYFLGGQNRDTVIRHNVNTNEVAEVGTLPVAIRDATAVWVPDIGVAYAFGGTPAANRRTVLQFDPTNGNVTTLPMSLPNDIYRGCSVFVPSENQVYMFGDSPLVRFDATTHSAEALTVEGWPLFLYGAGCVYVPRLNRIYIFGGYGKFGSEPNPWRNEISYIQLDTPETTEAPTPSDKPTTEEPICPPNGIVNLPYPGNCTLYIRCFDGVPHILSCYPLRFDTRELICRPVADAYCDEEGIPSTEQPIEPTTAPPEPELCPPIGYEVFPHESNCSKYYECNNGVAYESDCAANTYFDIHREIRRCNQAELANCNAECPVFGIEFQAIRVTGCKWYKVCIEGHSTNLVCGDGTMFDSHQQRCVADGEYNCPYMFAL